MTTFNKQFFLEDTPFDVEFEASPYVSAKISGPPENCHPAEGGEIELIEVQINGYDIMEFLNDGALLNLKELCEEAAPKMFDDLRNQALEDMAESLADQSDNWE